MKDLVNERPQPGRIAFLSPLLHCIAMPAIVYLRRSFGFVYLRPKSVFFAFSWAFLIFAYISWHEPAMWDSFWALCIFGTGAIILYWTHLLIAVLRQPNRSAEHDNFSGKSVLLHVARVLGTNSQNVELRVQLLAEPILILSVAALLRSRFDEHALSTWLILTAAAMAGKETINYWGSIRREKGRQDIIQDTHEQTSALATEQTPTEAPKQTRREPVKQPRNTTAADARQQEKRFAEILRLTPPLTLAKAEANYLTLIKLDHPDRDDNSAESNARAAELNEAIEFFRMRRN